MANGKRAVDRVAQAELPIPPALLARPGYAARRLHQAYVAAWVRMVDATVTGPQYAVLVAVESYPGADQGSLAHVAALDRSTMADVVRRLEDRGLLARHTAQGDARRKLLYLTEEGRDQVAELHARVRVLEARLAGDRSAAEIQVWLDGLTEFAEQWESLVAD